MLDIRDVATEIQGTSDQDQRNTWIQGKLYTVDTCVFCAKLGIPIFTGKRKWYFFSCLILWICLNFYKSLDKINMYCV